MKKHLIGFLAGIMVTASVVLFSAFKPYTEKEFVIIECDSYGLKIVTADKEEEVSIKAKEGTQQFLIQLKKYQQLGYKLISHNSSLISDVRAAHTALLEKD